MILVINMSKFGLLHYTLNSLSLQFRLIGIYLNETTENSIRRGELLHTLRTPTSKIIPTTHSLLFY